MSSAIGQIVGKNGFGLLGHPGSGFVIGTELGQDVEFSGGPLHWFQFRQQQMNHSEGDEVCKPSHEERD